MMLLQARLRSFPIVILVAVALTELVSAFRTTVSSPFRPNVAALFGRRTLVKEDHTSASVFHVPISESKSSKSPIIISEESDSDTDHDETGMVALGFQSFRTRLASTAASAVAVWTVASQQAVAANDALSAGSLNPATFQPVCPTADGFYRVLQSSVSSLVGQDKFIEYGPLIAGGLLRVRLELCVVESFFNEAVGPFIAENGLRWVLPLHETAETFLAGSIFAFATTFILISSSKILSVLAAYTDFLIGLPARVLGGFFFDRAAGKAVTLDVGVGVFKKRVLGPDAEAEEKVDFSKASAPGKVVLVFSGSLRLLGQGLKLIRDAFDALDIFVGRYLLFGATGYVLFKFAHFKIFPDFP